MSKQLVEIIGRNESPGRPLIYGTTLKFLNHFGLKDASQLPQLKDLETSESSIGKETFSKIDNHDTATDQ